MMLNQCQKMSKIQPFSNSDDVLAQRIDGQIYTIVRQEFEIRALLQDKTLQDMIEIYQCFGKHQLDFGVIYELE